MLRVMSVLMAASVIGSAIGQHSLVARLPDTRPPPFTIRGAFSEITEAFSERAFLIFAAGGLAAYVHQGMTFSITNYLNLFVNQQVRTGRYQELYGKWVGGGEAPDLTVKGVYR